MSCPALGVMARKKKALVRTMLFIVSVCMLTRLSAADPHTTFLWEYCGNSKYTNGSTFQSNLNQVLESLVRNVYPSGYNVSSIVVDEEKNDNRSVYGLVQCRGDLNPSDCQQCASTAKSSLVQKCHNAESGFIQLDGCFLHYNNSPFYSDPIETVPIEVRCGPTNSSRPQPSPLDVRAILFNITIKAMQSPELFAADSVAGPSSLTENVYRMAQCWRNMSPTSCGLCLTLALPNIFSCQTGTLGARCGSRNCFLRYDVNDFLDISFHSQRPAGSEGKRSKVLGISLGSVAATVGLIASIGLWKWNFFSCLKRWEQNSGTRGERGEFILSPMIANPELIMNYDIVREATSNFKTENKLGQGGFGSVFKGILPDGREIAVKRLCIGSKQGDVEFLNEANLINRIQHRNLVKLLGCSVESSERLLIYEYLQNNSLDQILFDTTKRHSLHWRKRYEIIVGTARGLAYLHEESDIRIIHRDIKASNILLDNKYRAKIADFGLAKLFAEDQSHVSTRVAGTLGYMAPEYALRGQLTEKADVFSFGVLVLEIISGRKNQSLAQDMEFLIEGTWRLYKSERALEVMDPTLEGSYSWEEGIRVIKIGLLCTQAAAALRPSMSRVVSMLTSKREQLPSPTRPAFIDLDCVDAPDQVRRPRAIVTPDRTLSGNRSSEAATHAPTPFDIYSAAADPSSGILEPR